MLTNSEEPLKDHLDIWTDHVASRQHWIMFPGWYVYTHIDLMPACSALQPQATWTLVDWHLAPDVGQASFHILSLKLRRDNVTSELDSQYAFCCSISNPSTCHHCTSQRMADFKPGWIASRKVAIAQGSQV